MFDLQMIFHWKKLENSILSLIDDVKDLLPPTDIENACEMIKHNEFECGFEIICEQLFEYEISVSPDIYKKIVEIGLSMEMAETKWIFLENLVSND